MKEHKQCYDCYSSVEHIKKCVRDGHQVLILMRGVPGSGKTYLARELLDLRQDGIICSTDDYFVDSSGNYNFNMGLLGEYHKRNYNKARDAILNCNTPVIIDNTNIRSEHMKPYIVQAYKNYYEIYIVEPVTVWNRKAGQCAARNIHGVTKEQIMEMLDDMDQEQDPSLESLLGKGYKVVLEPPMEDDNEDASGNINDLPITRAFGSMPPLFTPPPGLPLPNISSADPLFSLLHIPKPIKQIVVTRDMATQATDVIVTLSLVGLSEIIDDIVEGEYKEYEKMMEVPETRERQAQYVRRWQNDDFAFASELDLLVSVYPSEDMSTLYHNYQQYGLINTIKMNCDVGLMPDHTADVITGSFNKEIAKALETGSFDHEFIADTISEANTSTSNSDQTDDVNEQIYQVDIGKDFFKQLDTHFGDYPNDSRSTPTIAFLPESFLRKIYEAVLHQRAVVGLDTPDVDKDAEYARKLQAMEDDIRIPPRREMNGAQHLQFQQLLRDYPNFSATTLQELYTSTGYNATTTISCLTGTDHPPKKSQLQSMKPFSNTTKPLVTKTPVCTSREVDTPSYFDSANKKNHKSRYFDEAHKTVIQFIEKANEIKEKKDRIVSETYKCYSGSGLKSIHSVVHREKVASLAKQEREELNTVREIIFEANRQSKYLDLHYLSQQDSLKVVKERLEQLDRKDGNRNGSSRNLTIVTGYGKTSGGREIVKKFITGWLTSKQYKYHYSNKGSIEVTCK